MDEIASDMISAVAKRVARRNREAIICSSARSKKHMQIRADEAGQIVAMLRDIARAALAEKEKRR